MGKNIFELSQDGSCVVFSSVEAKKVFYLLLYKLKFSEGIEPLVLFNSNLNSFLRSLRDDLVNQGQNLGVNGFNFEFLAGVADVICQELHRLSWFDKNYNEKTETIRDIMAPADLTEKDIAIIRDQIESYIRRCEIVSSLASGVRTGGAE